MSEFKMKEVLAPILREQTPEVPKVNCFDQDLKDLAFGLLDFAKNWDDPKLAGLAANQISLDNERIMVNMCVVMNDNEEWIVAVNPKVYQHTEDKQLKQEGCLTWPNKIVEAERYSNVSIQYQDLDGKEVFHGATGFEASVWQHEINHLNGIKEKVINPKDGKIYGRSLDDKGIITCEKEKIGRNEPCPCGSGKKYKKCCNR